MSKMKLEYSHEEFPIEVVIKNNKNTYIRVKDNKIIITTNYFATNKYLEKLIHENYRSIVKMIETDRNRNKDKDKFKLFGKYYEIIYDNKIEKIEICNNIIYAKDEKTWIKWLDNFIKATFLDHLLNCYHLFEEPVPKPILRIRSMKTRWGVCNVKTHYITLNKELYRYEKDCLDYVCIHEIAHFIEGNHSKNFWNIVSKYCPNYKEIRKKLRG